MNYILFDDDAWENLLPLSYTRPVSEVRIGIMTLKDKWELLLQKKCNNLTQEYLQEKYPFKITDDNVLINSSILPTAEIVEAIKKLQLNEALIYRSLLIAVRLNKEKLVDFWYGDVSRYNQILFEPTVYIIEYPWNVFSLNDRALRDDFELLTKNLKTEFISKTNHVINEQDIYIAPSAKVEFATLNASTGPIYIDEDAEVMEGTLIRGPFYLGKHSTTKLGAKVYGATTIGPYSKVGGELNNVVILGYSNKAHDGFLGNAVIGEWCNIGADSNNSNLKNNYALVRMWSYKEERFVPTGLQFAGLVMGDHSKCGINTMFNTGTVIGVSANIFGAGFPRNFIPSFSWGGAAGFTTYAPKKAFETMELVMQRRQIELSQTDKDIIKKVFSLSEKYRKF
jgi:UDP-N-acetylglucosamine diphosphorylase/glucosamine-1-phosphate N-acetyltransferase